MATLFLEVGTPAEYPVGFLRDLSGAHRSDALAASQSTPPAGVTVTEDGITGTPTDMSAGPYKLTFTDSYNNRTATLEVLEGTPTVVPLDVPLTVPSIDLEAGVAYVVDVLVAGPDGSAIAIIDGDVPEGMTVPSNGSTINGTPTTGGEYPLSIDYRDMFDDPLDGTVETTVNVTSAVIVIPAPAAEGTEDGYILPDTPGVRWLVDGEETPPGSYAVQPVTEETTVTILPEALAGYEFDAAPEPLVLTFAPAPEDPEDPEDPAEWLHLLDDDPARALVASTLAPRALLHAGTAPDTAPAPAVAMAEGHLATVLEYVKGYTRGRGFHGYIPERPLQAVIIAATGRLVTNPEQVTYYSTGDYSERPATLTGWTLAELQVLRRYRRVTA